METLTGYLQAQCDDLSALLAANRSLRSALAASDRIGAMRAVGHRSSLVERMIAREQDAPPTQGVTGASLATICEIRHLGARLELLGRAVVAEDRVLEAHVDHARRLPGRHPAPSYYAAD